MRKVDTSLIVRLCLPQFAVGLFTTMLNNYLIYFYQPSKASGIPDLIPQGRLVLGVLTIIGMIKAVGHIIDAVTDPLIAAGSDKSRHKDGRRIPLMKKAAIPFGLCALLIFFTPLNRVSGLNAAWIAAFMWGYYFFFTLYMIPHNALIPELIQDGPVRVNAYTISSFFFVTGSALGYVSPLIVSAFKGAGMATLSVWRTTFGIYTVIGVILLLIPAYTIKETEYVHSVIPNVTLGQSLKHAFANEHFRLVTLGQLLENTGMAFFQACIMYYVTSLMGLAETYSVLILAISIAGSLLMYPLVNKFAKKRGKKLPIILGCIVFSAAEIVICFSDMLPGNRLVLACVFALFVSFPFAVLNVLPGAMMAVHEKGRCTARLIARNLPGHAGLEGGHKTPVMRMAAFIAEADEKKLYIRRLHPEVRGMFERLLIKLIPKLNAADARQFTDLSDAVIRFAPIDIDKQQYASVHGENENISVDKLHLAVDFYKALLRNYPADIR